MIFTFADEAGDTEKRLVEQLAGFCCRLTIPDWEPMDIEVDEVWIDDEGFATLRFHILDEDSNRTNVSNVRLTEPHELHVY